MTIQRLSPRECHSLMESEGYVYVDVRSIPEFDGGHPAGAYNVPVAHAGAGGMQPNPDFVAVMETAFPKDTKLVIGCLSGGRSQRAVAMLLSAGFTAMVEQRAGWGGVRDPYGRVSEPGWSSEALPSATGPESSRGYAALKK